MSNFRVWYLGPNTSLLVAWILEPFGLQIPNQTSPCANKDYMQDCTPYLIKVVPHEASPQAPVPSSYVNQCPSLGWGIPSNLTKSYQISHISLCAALRMLTFLSFLAALNLSQQSSLKGSFQLWAKAWFRVLGPKPGLGF